MVALAALLALTLPPLALRMSPAGLQRPLTPETYAALSLSFASTVALLSAVLFGSDAISSEFERGTGYLILPYPVSRGTLLVGKFLASLLPTWSMVALFCGAVAFGVRVRFGAVPQGVLAGGAWALAVAGAELAVAYAISALMASSAVSVVATLLLFMLFLPLLDLAAGLAGARPLYSLSWASNIIEASVVGGAEWEALGLAARRVLARNPSPGQAAAIAAAYLAVGLSVAWARFRSREVK